MEPFKTNRSAQSGCGRKKHDLSSRKRVGPATPVTARLESRVTGERGDDFLSRLRKQEKVHFKDIAARFLSDRNENYRRKRLGKLYIALRTKKRIRLYRG